MKILIDAFGGDNAPLEIIKGSIDARQQLGCDIVLVGNEEAVRACAAENQLDLTGLILHNAGEGIPVEEDPRKILKEYRNSSMGTGLQMLAAGEGDAFVSCGSTGALVIGANYFVKRIRGVRRAAIGTLIPSDKDPYLLLDCGANINCTPDTLNVFAIMGKIFMEKVRGVENPRIGLANIGVEPNKGTELQVKAYPFLEASEDYNFIGNVEFRDIPYGAADVVVCDGYTGNVYLKTLEGTAMMLMGMVKGILTKNALTKVGALTMMGGVKDLKKRMDLNEYGGAPIIGLRRPVIKGHGVVKAKAMTSAIREAIKYADSGVIEAIAASVPQREDRAVEEEAE